MEFIQLYFGHLFYCDLCLRKHIKKKDPTAKQWFRRVSYGHNYTNSCAYSLTLPDLQSLSISGQLIVKNEYLWSLSLDSIHQLKVKILSAKFLLLRPFLSAFKLSVWSLVKVFLNWLNNKGRKMDPAQLLFLLHLMFSKLLFHNLIFLVRHQVSCLNMILLAQKFWPEYVWDDTNCNLNLSNRPQPLKWVVERARPKDSVKLSSFEK